MGVARVVFPSRRRGSPHTGISLEVMSDINKVTYREASISRKKLNKVLKAENANGWRYRSHTSNSFNLVSFIVNLFFLVLTLTVWSAGARNLLVLDRME